MIEIDQEMAARCNSHAATFGLRINEYAEQSWSRFMNRVTPQNIPPKIDESCLTPESQEILEWIAANRKGAVFLGGDFSYDRPERPHSLYLWVSYELAEDAALFKMFWY